MNVVDLADLIDREVHSRADQVQAVLVAHCGEVVVERYYPGVERDLLWAPPARPDVPIEWGPAYPVCEHPDQPHNIRSATKSVLAALVGIALDQRVLESLDLPIRTYLADVLDGPGDPRGAITLRDLLEMRSGLGWVENGEMTMAWITSSNPVAYALDGVPIVAAPGSRWNYSTVDSHLLSACLQQACGTTTAEFAGHHLFEPLGIHAPRWTADAAGVTVGGSELFLTPRQMVRFGELVRRRGEVDGERILPAGWVDHMLRRQEGVDEATLLAGLAERGVTWPSGVPVRRRGYGSHWWWSDVDGHPAYCALGLGGQFIMVVDQLELVCVQVASTTAAFPPEETPYREAAALGLFDRCARELVGELRGAAAAGAGLGSAGT